MTAYEHSTRLDYLGTRMPELHTNVLYYTRGNATLKVENFTPEKIDVDQLQAYGIAIITEKWQDFVFDFSVLGCLNPPTPREGDKISWCSQLFEVCSINNELYTFTTSSRKRIRIHAKQVQELLT